MCHHWFTISIERFKIEIAQFPLSISNMDVLQLKLHDSRVQIQIPQFPLSNLNDILFMFKFK
jgi:hypothetical protein